MKLDPMDIYDGFRCKHSHTAQKHPHCFLKMLSKIDPHPKWYKKARVCYLDVESTNLKASFGVMLSWAIKERGGKTYFDVLKPKDFDADIQDKRIVESLVQKLSQYNLIVTYYGTKFDIPFIRSRALYWGIPFPAYGNIFQLDMYYVVRSKLSLHSNRLQAAAEFLGIKGKTPIDNVFWRRAIFGDQKALHEILRHNIGDVVVLELVHNRMQPFLKGNKTSI